MATVTATRKPTPTVAPPAPTINNIPDVLLVGDIFRIGGSGFTNGSAVNLFVATLTGR
jgi:hypothetical protein